MIDRVNTLSARLLHSMKILDVIFERLHRAARQPTEDPIGNEVV